MGFFFQLPPPSERQLNAFNGNSTAYEPGKKEVKKHEKMISLEVVNSNAAHIMGFSACSLRVSFTQK